MSKDAQPPNWSHRVHSLRLLRRLQCLEPRPVQPLRVRHRDAHGRGRDVALLRPQRPQQRVRERQRLQPFEAVELRSDDHPARVLVPVRVLGHLLRVVPRLQVQRHVEVVAPARQLLGMVRAAGLGARPYRDATVPWRDILEVKRLQDEPAAVALDNLLQLRPAEVGPGRGERVVARQLHDGCVVVPAGSRGRGGGG